MMLPLEKHPCLSKVAEFNLQGIQLKTIRHAKAVNFKDRGKGGRQPTNASFIRMVGSELAQKYIGEEGEWFVNCFL